MSGQRATTAHGRLPDPRGPTARDPTPVPVGQRGLWLTQGTSGSPQSLATRGCGAEGLVAYAGNPTAAVGIGEECPKKRLELCPDTTVSLSTRP